MNPSVSIVKSCYLLKCHDSLMYSFADTDPSAAVAE